VLKLSSNVNECKPLLLGAIPEDTEVIVSTNRGEPLVLKKKLTLAGIAYENAARRVVGKKDFLIDLEQPRKVGRCRLNR